MNSTRKKGRRGPHQPRSDAAAVSLAMVVVAVLACARVIAVPPSEPAPAATLVVIPKPPIVPAPSPEVARRILRRAGDILVEGGGPQPATEVRLRGVAFGNNVWGRQAIPRQHHSEADFARVAAMGMNAVRFYMFYGTFEDEAHPYVYRDAGWRWLDQNVAWARAHHVYLILNMHVPQGGFQSQGEGRALWDVPANQDRLVALWTAIAARYANEPTVAAYDLLNEPGVSRDRGQWQSLATRLVKAIRQVDPRHLLIVERVNSVAKNWDNDANMNFVTVDDSNIAYTFHFYEPIAYTHQLASWIGLGEGGPYPNAHAVARTGNTQWLGIAAFDSPRLPAGNSDWLLSRGPRLRVDDPRVSVGRLSLVAKKVAGGRVFYDDLVVEEFDPRGRKVGDVLKVDPKGTGGWFFWTANGSGRSAAVGDGHDGPGSLMITGTTDDANLGAWSQEFLPVRGHSYALSGWMKGTNVPGDANVQIRLDFLGGGGVPMPRNKEFLAAEFARYVAWGHAHHVPLFLGEFGVFKVCFEKERGGLNWVNDVIDLAEANGISFTYHAYHEDGFGLYRGSGPVDPANANQPLIDLLTRKFVPVAAQGDAARPPPSSRQ